MVNCGLVALFDVALVLVLLCIFVAAGLVYVLLTCVLACVVLCLFGLLLLGLSVRRLVDLVVWFRFRLLGCCLVRCVRCVFLIVLWVFVLLLLVWTWFGLPLCCLIRTGV